MAASQVLDVYQWLLLLHLGGTVGALGQLARTIVGLKKLHDAASDEARPTADLIEPSRLLTSLAIGFVAGALAAIPLLGNLSQITTQQIFTLAASGYAGADFVEGFISRNPSVARASIGNGTSDGAVG